MKFVYQKNWKLIKDRKKEQIKIDTTWQRKTEGKKTDSKKDRSKNNTIKHFFSFLDHWRIGGADIRDESSRSKPSPKRSQKDSADLRNSGSERTERKIVRNQFLFGGPSGRTSCKWEEEGIGHGWDSERFGRTVAKVERGIVGHL